MLIVFSSTDSLLGVIWLDYGNDLWTSPAGPWNSGTTRTYSWDLDISPTIVHSPNIAFKAKYIKSSRRQNSQKTIKFPQTAQSLHTDYGRLLHQSTSMADPFYAISGMFDFAAASESQFLNMIEQKIESEAARTIGAVLGDDLDSQYARGFTLSNLLYNKRILDQHVRRLKETITCIRSRGDPKWPRATEERLHQKSEEMANRLLIDFNYLLERAEILSRTCDRGIGASSHNAVVAESRAALDQAERVSKLTFLAFLFVPASFTTSLFGMNFRQFESGHLSMWNVWFPVLAGTYAVSFLVFHSDQVSSLIRIIWRYARGRGDSS
jgi:hypothetical protein